MGFRPFVYRLAAALGVGGEVSNDSLGVLIDAVGTPFVLDELVRRLVDEHPPLAQVESLAVISSGPAAPAAAAGSAPVAGPAAGPVAGPPPFRIVESRASGVAAVAVPADVATCDDCARELADPTDRRFRYPFINCTNCGPRYTIIRSIPYDRASTTMAGFAMCARCQAEYEDPGDRRFHAEPNACPACGPHVRYLDTTGSVLAEREDALARATADLAGGGILGIKGLGGYHLTCDAADEVAVATLRSRKGRFDKPFALMVRTLDEARRLCVLGPEAEAALCSARRPIVLAPRLAPRMATAAAVASAVAPGLPELGLMLPYTPLHHILMEAVGRPLVMTSGNRSDEPIAHDDSDALTRLSPLVDALLVHDRPIHIRCDDSVVRYDPAGAVQMVRRSRGFAPEPIALARPSRRHVLAVGAELKSTVAVAKGGTVVASHHVGDLEHPAAYESFRQAVGHLCHLAGVEPEVVVHDLHPEYLSTKFALDLDLPSLGVQHHWAHIASNLAEHRVDPEEEVLGVAFDGLGLGTDGTIWGGEFLVASLRSYRRVGHLLPVPLVGGDLATREPWRMAMVWADAALGEAAAAAFGASIDDRWAAVLALAHRPDTILTSSTGRLFDAVAALLGLRTAVTYEAQAAIELEARASGARPGSATRFPMEVHEAGGEAVLDPTAAVAAVIEAHGRGDNVGSIAASFHLSLGQATADLAAQLAQESGLRTVALSGGVFQNALLSAEVAGSLRGRGLRVLLHRRVPPNDGGISIGQAAVAAASGDGT